MKPVNSVEDLARTSCWRELSTDHQSKVVDIVKQLEQGMSVKELKGVKIKRDGRYWRFRINRDYRLIVNKDSERRELCLINRKALRKTVGSI